MSDPDTKIGGPAARFPDTRITAVGAAGSAVASERQAGQQALIEAYWKPVYKYIRWKWRASNEEAKDSTQAFFARAIDKQYFRAYDPAKGAFRTYLRACLDRFLANEYKSARRLKRSGDLPEPAAAPSPDEFLEREWLRNLFDMALHALRAECETRGQLRHYELFERYDIEESEGARPTYAQLAEAFGLSTTDVTNHLAAVRRRFRRIVLDKLRGLAASEREYRADARRVLGIDV